MTATRIRRATLSLGLAGVAAAALISGGGTVATAKPSADKTAAQAQEALSKGQIDKAISLAEAVVEAAPREPAYRTMLGNAYLRAGRFESAVTTFTDAMQLGDNSARTALALALANVAAGNNRDAVVILDDWREAIPASDLGLALALAGETSRGTAVLADTLRNGEATSKVRQNLAYAYALDGRWREARVMLAQDISADKIDDRVSEWAMQASPENFKKRVATLLAVPVRSDPGQPQVLALRSSSSPEQLAVENTEAKAAAVSADAQLAPIEPVALASSAPADAPAAAPPETIAQAQSFASAFVENPVVQPIPANAIRIAADRPARVAPARISPVRVAYNAAPTRAATRPVMNGSHLVQLGSFSSAQGARRASALFVARNPSLRSYRMTITPAVVRGKNFWRVAAAGFDAGSAKGMCSSVKLRGGACFAYSALPARANVPGKIVPVGGSSGHQLARRR